MRTGLINSDCQINKVKDLLATKYIYYQQSLNIIMKLYTTIAISIIPAISAFAPTSFNNVHNARSDVKLEMATRRDAIAELASGFAITSVLANGVFVEPAVAESVTVAPLAGTPQDNEIVKEQRQVPDKLDINNSAVADYMQYPGMYPNIGGKIANNGPYASVKDVYKLKILSKAEQDTIKKYESKLVATPATGLDTLRGRDPYRRSFNKPFAN